VNGQPATYVIGQPNFISSVVNNGGTTLGLNNPEGVWIANSKLYVADRGNNRVLRYTYPLIGNYPTPERVFGQAGLAGILPNQGAAAGANTLSGAGQIFVENDNLWVCDMFNNRVLRFPNASTAAANPSADLVIGQPDFITTTPLTAQNRMSQPRGIALDVANNKLYVVDEMNRRVLRFDFTALANGMMAEAVFGQMDFISVAPASTNNNRFQAPYYAATDAINNLYVSDGASNRVLRFGNAHLKPSGDLATADGVFGQPDFLMSGPAALPERFNTPIGIFISGTDLYVADFGNNRVVRHLNASTRTIGVPPNADVVLGQQIFTTFATPVKREFMNGPMCPFYDAANTRLFAVEYNNHRVLQFDQNLPILNTASPLLSANNGAPGPIPPPQVIAPAFSQAMNTPTATNFRVFGGMTGLKAGTYAATPSYTPTTPYQRGEIIEYTITTGATLGDGASSSAGNKPYLNGLRPLAPATPFVGSFRTATTPLPLGVNPNFVLSTYANIGGNAVAIVPADFDGDGYIDFAAASGTANRIAVRRNYGMGNFAKTVAATEFLDIPVAGITDLKAADVNNDGKPDWVFTSGTNVSTCANTSTPGALSAGVPTATAVGGTALKLATGDFDGNGFIDIAVVTSAPNQLRIFLNTNGAFAAFFTIVVPGVPSAIATGDINRDGAMDILVGLNNSTYAFINNGGGGFGQNYIAQSFVGIAAQIVVGDLNNANGPDIVTIVPNCTNPVMSSTIYCSPNDGTANFPTLSSFALNLPNFPATSGGLELGDINGDGRLDIVAVNPQTAGTPAKLTWFLNNPLGAFNGGATFSGSTSIVDPTAQVITLCDVDQDGDLDALVGFGTGAAFPYVAVLRNEQQTTPTAFVPPINAQNIGRSGVIIDQSFSAVTSTGTFSNVDGITPAPLQGGPIRIYGNMAGGRSRVGGSGGTWTGFPTPPTATIARFTPLPSPLLVPTPPNQFFPNELISVSIPNFQTNAVKNNRFVPITSGTATNLGGHVRQFRTRVVGGQGVFVERQTNAGAASTWGVATGDFNNDGRLDIALGQGAELRILNGNGDGSFAAPALYNTANHRFERRVIAADVNNDGWLDLVGAINLSNAFVVSLNNGSGGFPIATQFATGAPTYGLAVADFNGDGFLDVVANNFAATPVICLGTGTGTFSAAVALPVLAALDITSGDFDADGDIDIACAVMGGTMRWYINNGNGTFFLSPTILTAGGQGLRTGDVNGDGRPDIVTVDATNLYVYLHNGTPSTFNAAPSTTIAHNGTTLPDIELADVDGDLDLDAMMLSQGAGNPTARLALNIGGASIFEMRGNTTTGFSPNHIAPADFDGDGDIDFAVSNFGANYVSVLINARPPRINPIAPPAPPPPLGSFANYTRDVQPQRNSHTQAFGTFPVQVRFDQPVTSATASFPMVLPPSLMDRGAIRIHGSMTGHRSTPAAVGTWNYINATNTAEYVPPAGNPFRAGETVMVTVTNAQASTPGNIVFSTSPTVYAFTVAPSGGTGRFVDSRRYDDAGSSQSVALADFDLDGRIDMMQASSMGLNLRLQNNPLGNPTSFANGATNIVAGNITHALAADFDSDGRPDVAYIVGTNIVVRRNDPLGAFGTVLATIPSGTAGLNKLAVADFDGDGDMDIALAANSIRVFLNNGSATAFTLAVNTAFVANSIAALDADMDGDIDLVITNPPSTLVYLNRGSAPNLFSATADFTLATAGAQEIAFGDFNSDTYPDLAIGELGTNNLFVLMNQANGTGNFMPATAYNTGSSNSIPVVGRFDGDNILDIAVVKPNNADSKIMLYRGDGAGLFELVSSSAFMESTNVPFNALMLPQAADIDGDGDLDLAIPLLNGNRTAILYNHQPELKVQATSPVANASSVALPVGITTIFNQNVTNNTATLPPTGPLRVFGSMTGGRARIGGGTWSSPAPPINQATFSANLLGASTIRYYPGEKVEFVASTNTYVQGLPGVANTVPMTTGTVRQFTVKAGVGPGTFFELTRYLGGVSNAPEQTLLVDVNNDGRLDLITISNGSGNFHVQFGIGNGTFGVPVPVVIAGTGFRIVAGDFDNDGDLDLAASSNGSDNISIYRNDPVGTFTLASNVNCNATGGSRFLCVADMNGDGNLDIVSSNLSNSSSQPFSILFGTGIGTFNPGRPLDDATPHNPDIMTLGDVDNDGDIDVIMSSQGGTTGILVYYNDGIGRFGTSLAAPIQKQILAMGTSFAGVDVGDIDNDGDLDIVAADFAGNNISTFSNTPLGTFSFTSNVGVVAGSLLRGLQLADVNGDARLDVVVSSFTDSYIAVLQNTGLGFAAPTYFRGSVSNPRLFALGDIDGDGDLDLAAPNQTAPQDVTIFLNATQPRFVCTAGCGPVTYTPNISPQRNVNNALTASLLTWQFTEPMTTATASFPTAVPPAGTGGPIRVFGNMRASRSLNGSGAGGPWTYTALAPNTTATLAPARAMLPGEEMMVSVTNARAVSGIAVRPYVYGFRARAGVGPGQFYPRFATPVPAGNGARALAFGNMDGDNFVDMVVANQFANSVTVRTGDGTGDFPAQTTGSPFATGGNFPLQVILADMDNNGTLDVLTANAAGGANGLSVLFNPGGTGILGTAVNYNVGGNPTSIAIGDVDSDGDLDIVAVDAGSGFATVRFNNGTGTLTAAAPTYSIGTGQAFVSLSDVDNDGDLDMIATNGGGAANVTVRLNDGIGNFTGTALGSPYAAAGAITVDMGDVDNDGDNDMLLTLGLGDVVVRINNGLASGNFMTIGTTFTVGVGVQKASFGDVNGDGNLDIITTIGPVGLAGTLSVRLGNGAGVFTDAANMPFGVLADARGFALADVDGDGDLDVGVAHQGTGNNVMIMLNATQPRLVCASSIDCGPPTYTRTVSPQRNVNTALQLPIMSWQFTEQVTAATYTSIGAAQGAIRIFGAMSGGQRNISGGGAWGYVIAITTASFSPARRFLPGEEVMVSMTSAQSPARVNVRPFVYSYRTRAGTGPAIFGNQSLSPYAAGMTPRDVALGDLDGDGDVDMVVATATGIVRRLNDGTADFSMGNITIPAGFVNLTAIALGDADNDGDLDIAVCGGGSVSVLLNDGMGVFTTMPTFPQSPIAGASFNDVQWGDADGNGSLDLALANTNGNGVVIGLNNFNAPVTKFIFSPTYATSGAPATVSFSDIDADGDMDVLAANNSGMVGLAVLQNSGTGVFTLMGAPNPTSMGAHGVTTGDLDGDGDNDAIVTVNDADNVAVFLNNGFGTFSLSATYPAGGMQPRHVRLGDVDGDGDLDMLVSNMVANTVILRRNNGTADFTQTGAGSPYGTGMSPEGLALADLDGDGDLDIASANSSGNNASVLLNQGNAGLAFSLTNVGFRNTFNAGNLTVVSRAATRFTIGSFLGRFNLSNTNATLQYSIQAAGGGTAQLFMLGSTQGTITSTSITTTATFIWRNAPIGGGTTTAVITVAPTFAGLLNATQVTVTIISEPAYPVTLAYSQVSSTGTQGVNFGAFNQGQLLIANGRPFNLAFGAWNGWNELAATNATVRLRALNSAGATDNFVVNSVASITNFLNNSSTNLFAGLRISWLNAPETAVSTQVTISLVCETLPMLGSTTLTLTMTRLALQPQITSFSPTTGGTGTIITVRGLTLGAVNAAQIAGVPVQSITINSSTQVTIVAAAGTSGTITLSNNFGTGESTQIFSFVQPPTVIGVQPSRVCAGQTLTITGTNFEDTQQVFVGSVPATSFRLNVMGQLEAVVPNGAESGIVTVFNRAGTATGATVLVQTPVITRVQPTAVGTGGTITVIGSNFQNVVSASLGSNALTVSVLNSTTLTLTLPTTAQVITAPLGLASASSCVVFSTQAIAIAAPPTLTMISMPSIEVGQTLVVSGTNFVPGSVVILRGFLGGGLAEVTAASVMVISPTELQVVFGVNALAVAANGATLQVTTPFGTATLMGGLLTLRPQSVFPTGIEFTPERGTANTTVTITGRGFINVRQVFFGRTPALRFVVESPERIVAIVSTGATGTVLVTSTTGTGESQKIFTYLTPQELDSIAALALYRATNGMNWTTNANWQSNAPYSRWYGLTVSSAGRITAVNLPNNGLTGSITNAVIALSQMNQLQTVNLAGNAIGGTLGSVVAGLRSVRTLNLANTQLSGRLPIELGTLDSLEVLKLDSNRLGGSIGDVFCSLLGRPIRDYSLRELRLSANRFTGEIPPCIVLFRRLQILHVQDNLFTGRIPEGINNLSLLREFVLARNQLTGQLPRSLDSTTFAAFAGNGNGVGKETAQTQALSQVEIFDVSNNQLTGTIPNGIAQSKGLKTLLLNDNALTGNLPETIASLVSLETLNAARNQLSGSLWENIGAMRSLKMLSLQSNRLSGEIPVSIGSLGNLERAELDNNTFSGVIPTEVRNLRSLRVLGLSANQFTSVPSLTALRSHLDTLRLERNRLTFESLEPNVQMRNITYSPQDSVGAPQNLTYLIGQPISLRLVVGGAENRYQWFKDGRAVSLLQDSPDFALTDNALTSLSGVYECRITNGLARNLTLYGRPWTIRVETSGVTTPESAGNQVAAPVLTFPTIAARNMPYTLPLRWKASEGARVYEVQMSFSNDFAMLITTATILETTQTVSGLRPGTRFYWRVRGIGSDGQRSAWSQSSFTTGIADKPMQMTSIDFGKVAIGDTAIGEVLIVNFSNVSQTLQRITLDDPNLSFTILDTVNQEIVPPEKYITVRVRFAPRTNRVMLANSILRYNEVLRPEREDLVENILQGTGVGLKLSNVDFDTVRAGGTTIRSATLINVSARPVVIKDARTQNTSGDSTIFSVESYLGDKNFTLQPNDTMNIVVKCTPPNVGRKFAGLLVIGDDAVTSEIRAVARAYKEGDVVVRFGTRPERDMVAPGGEVGLQLYIKADTLTKNLTRDLLRAVRPTFKAKFRFNSEVVVMDRAENRVQQQTFNGVSFITIPSTQWNFDGVSNAAREATLITLKARSVSGSVTTTTLQIQDASWEALATGGSSSLFVESPINGTFTSRACQAGGTRLTTTAKGNAVAITRPNPVKDVAEVLYTVREDGDIELAVYDVTGRKAQVITSGYAEAGEYSLLLNAKTLPTGAYFLVLQTSSGVVQRRMDVIK
jgi:Leucine-rich repeat (LRR) protein